LRSFFLENSLIMTALEKATNWLAQPIDQETKTAIQALIEGPSELLEDAFYTDLEFGTGGMRGVMGVGSNRVNKFTFGMATQGLSNYLLKSFAGEKVKVAIAHDCRNNSPEFARMVADIFSANGIEVFLFDALRPTPQLSFAIRHLNCQSGIVITASHNPPEYNGYKVYWNDGAQIVAPHDKGIIDEVRAITNVGDIKFDANESLIEMGSAELDEAFLTASLAQRKTNSTTSDLNIVFTSLHGTAITLMPELLKRAGFNQLQIVAEQAEPDGNFPTVKSPNPEERAALDMALALADKTQADIVIGTDPDSDRIGIAARNSDGEMVLLNGNQTGILLTDYLLKKTELKGDEFIAYTIVSSDMFADVAKSHNTDFEICLTGFKHIASLIRENEGVKTFVGGGEESYGFMIGDFVRDKDALTSALLFCDLASEAKANGKNVVNLLEDLYRKHGFYYEHLISIVKKGKDGKADIANMMSALRKNPPQILGGEKVVRIDDIGEGFSTELMSGHQSPISLPKSNVLQFFTEGGSKISARPSGTEPKIKFYFSVKAPWNDSLSFSEQEKILSNQINQIVEDLGVD
jgi:phosphoglucomutase